MTKRKNKEIENFIQGMAGLVVLVSFWLSYTDKAKFYFFISVVMLVVLISLVIAFKIKKHRFDNVYSWHSGKSLITQLQKMHPTEFEEYIEDLYTRLGYNAEAVGKSHDGGIDVIISKGGASHYVQCKKFITSKVGVGDMRDFYGAMAGKLTDSKGIFITTNIFTTEAERFAEDKPIELIDGDKLLKLIKLAKKDKEEIVINIDNKCSKCGGKMIEKNGKYGKFLGCSNYPDCKNTRKR